MLDLHIHADRVRDIIREYNQANAAKNYGIRDSVTYRAISVLEVLLAIHDRNQEAKNED